VSSTRNSVSSIFSEQIFCPYYPPTHKKIEPKKRGEEKEGFNRDEARRKKGSVEVLDNIFGGNILPEVCP